MSYGFLAPKHNYINLLSHLLTLSVPDEDYSINAPCVLIYIFTVYLFIFVDVIYTRQ